MSNKEIFPENIQVDVLDVINGLITHTDNVKNVVNVITTMARLQAVSHDKDKMDTIDQWALFRKIDATGYKFGTPEYTKFKELLFAEYPGLADLVHKHTRDNRHHPEHFGNDLSKMNLVDLIEMVGDWYVASTTRKSGNKTFEEMMDFNAKRFNMDPQLKGIILNTLNLLKSEVEK